MIMEDIKEELKTITIECIKVQAGLGEKIDECLKECAYLSAITNCYVELNHNDRKITIDPSKVKFNQ